MTVPPRHPGCQGHTARPPIAWMQAETRRILDRLDRRPYGGDCPDCTAAAGQPCDATCLRYREDPGE